MSPRDDLDPLAVPLGVEQSARGGTIEPSVLRGTEERAIGDRAPVGDRGEAREPGEETGGSYLPGFRLCCVGR
jgi:hypothetical protein